MGCRTQQRLLSTKITSTCLPKESPMKSIDNLPYPTTNTCSSQVSQRPPALTQALKTQFVFTEAQLFVLLLLTQAVKLFQHPLRTSKRYRSVLHLDKEMQLPLFLRSSDTSWPCSKWERTWKTSCQICYFTTFPLAERAPEASLPLATLGCRGCTSCSYYRHLPPQNTPHPKPRANRITPPTLTCFPF